MEKILSILFLTGFLAVLAVPLVVSAANCPNSCEVASVNCDCGGDTVSASDPKYCLNGVRYNLNAEGKAACIAAQTTSGGTGSFTTPAGLVAKIEQIGGYIFNILLAIAGIFLVVAGFFFVTAGGDPMKVNTARQMLINALIGVAIAVAAKGLVILIQNTVGR